MRESDDSPYHFDLSSLKTISPLFTQSESGIAKRCGFHTSTLDLTPYHNKISADLTIPIELSPPTADFKIVATDVEQFLKYADLPISRGEKYYVRLSFENLIASFSMYQPGNLTDTMTLPLLNCHYHLYLQSRLKSLPVGFLPRVRGSMCPSV